MDNRESSLTAAGGSASITITVTSPDTWDGDPAAVSYTTAFAAPATAMPAWKIYNVVMTLVSRTRQAADQTIVWR